MCLEVWDHDATDAIVYSNGCTLGISSITFTNGYITGLTDTVVVLTDDLGTQRAVTVSLAMPVSGSIMRSVDSTTYLDGACTVFWTGRSRTAPVAGSITVAGAALAATGTSVQLFVKTRTRC